MRYRLRIAVWFVASAMVLIVILMTSTYLQIEEELSDTEVDETHPARADWNIHNSYHESEIRDIMQELLRTWMWVGAPVLGLSIGAGLLLARRSLQPVNEVNRQLEAMNPEALKGNIRVSDDDAVFRGLARHLNSLLDRAGEAYREQAEFSARVAHELRTPLMLLRSRIEKESSGIPPATLEGLQDELSRLSRFVESALLAAKAESGTLVSCNEAVDVSQLLHNISDGYNWLVKERGLRFDLDVADHLCCMTDSDLLLRALHGLMENAVRYSKSHITLHAALSGGRVCIEIQNDRSPRSMAVPGLGLGLRLVRAIARATDSEFHISSPPEKFIVRLILPASPSDLETR